MPRAVEIPAGYRLPESDDELLAECDVHVFRASGPGGQSVNTTDSAVRLVHRPTGMRVQCQRERSQLRNKRECVLRLRARLEALLRPTTKRQPTAPSHAARERRLDDKRRRGRTKTARRPPSDDE